MKVICFSGDLSNCSFQIFNIWTHKQTQCLFIPSKRKMKIFHWFCLDGFSCRKKRKVKIIGIIRNLKKLHYVWVDKYLLKMVDLYLHICNHLYTLREIKERLKLKLICDQDDVPSSSDFDGTLLFIFWLMLDTTEYMCEWGKWFVNPIYWSVN